MATTVTYKGSTLTTVNNQTRTLETAGTYLEDDITLVDVSQSSQTLQSKTVSPSTSSQTVQPDAGYDGLSSVTVNAISPTKAAETYYPSSSDQTVSSGRWLTGSQTFKGVQIANLTAGNIKDGVTVTVGDSSNPSRVASVTGTYSGGGGGGLQVYTSTDIEWYDDKITCYFPNGIQESDFANLKAGFLNNISLTVDGNPCTINKITFSGNYEFFEFFGMPDFAGYMLWAYGYSYSQNAIEFQVIEFTQTAVIEIGSIDSMELII